MEEVEGLWIRKPSLNIFSPIWLPSECQSLSAGHVSVSLGIRRRHADRLAHLMFSEQDNKTLSWIFAAKKQITVTGPLFVTLQFNQDQHEIKDQVSLDTTAQCGSILGWGGCRLSTRWNNNDAAASGFSEDTSLLLLLRCQLTLSAINFVVDQTYNFNFHLSGAVSRVP